LGAKSGRHLKIKPRSVSGVDVAQQAIQAEGAGADQVGRTFDGLWWNAVHVVCSSASARFKSGHDARMPSLGPISLRNALGARRGKLADRENGLPWRAVCRNSLPPFIWTPTRWNSCLEGESRRLP